MAATSLNVNIEEIDLLVSGDSSRNSAKIHVTGECDTDDSPVIKCIASPIGCVTTSVGKVSVVSTLDLNSFSCYITVTAKDLTAAASDIKLTISSTGVTSKTVTIKKIKLYPTWTVSTNSLAFTNLSSDTKTISIADAIHEIPNNARVFSKESGGVEDKSKNEYLAINTNGIEYGTILVNVGTTGKSITSDVADSFIVYTAADDDYVSKTQTINCNISYVQEQIEQTWTISSPSYGTDHSIPYLATDDFSITLSKAVGAAGISTGEKTISESSNTLIVNRVPDNFSYIFSVKKTGTVTPGKVYCISIVSEADDTYNVKTVNFYVKFSESEPKPLVNEATLLSDTKIWAHSNYKIKRECLPAWHPGYGVTGDIDLSEVLIYNNKISSHYISLEDNYFKTNDTGDYIYTYTDKDLPNSLNIGKYYKHGTDMDHNFFIAGANPGFGIVYDSKILVRYRYIQINKNEKCIKIFHDAGYSVPILDVTLTADNFRDKVFPIEFYLLICGKGGDAGKYKTLDNRNYHGVIGTAGSGAGNVLMKINLSKIYTSAAGVATITIENTEDNLTIYTNKADIATKYIKIGHGQNGVLITYDTISGNIEDESNDYKVITGGTVDYNLPNGISMIMYNDGGYAKFTTTSVYDRPAETSQSIVIKSYSPYNSIFDGYCFPGGTFSGGAYTIKTDKYENSIIGNGGGASGLAAGQTANYYNDIQDISTKYGAGSGAIDYGLYNPSSADIQKKQNVNSPGGPAYFAILY